MTASESRLLARVVLPTDHDLDVMPLYVDADYWSSFPLYEDAETREAQRGFLHPDTDRAVVRLSDTGIESAIRGRRSVAVPHRRSISFGTYFNAFPASYWKKWTSLEEVVLTVRTSGVGQVIVYRSNARGVIQRVESVHVEGDNTAEFVLPFTFFGDGGWFWFDLAAGVEDFALVEAGWYAPESAVLRTGRSGTATVSITTLNRVPYLVKLLSDLGQAPEVLESIDRILVIDQGTDRLAAADGIEEVRTALHGRLEIIEQANLGGSGGFARGMHEVLTRGESDHILLLDDDIAIEPESIWRALRFADHRLKPGIVGGHMFDMYDKTALHAYAEDVDPDVFMWGPITPGRHRFATSNLRQTSWIHRRVDAGYNGWWMSLISVEVMREVGLSLPVFIKWDDAEYSLRAASRGFSTVSLPGAAVWHVSWVDKDDSQDWQAFYHARNRLVAALLHSTRTRGGRLPRHNLAIDLKHLFSMQYFAVAARHAAYRSVLEGPSSLHAELPERLGKIRQLASRFSDGSPIRSKADYPAVVPSRHSPRMSRMRRHPPRGLGLRVFLARTALRHWFSPVTEDAAPQTHLAFEEARWWVVPFYDSVLVTNAEGSAVLWHKRNPALFRTMLIDSIRFHLTIRRRWGALRGQYRRGLKKLVSLESWSDTFDRSRR